MKTTPPRVEVLSTPGCPNAAETLRLVRKTAAAAVSGVAILDTRLSEAQARERGIPGSPTVLVDGRDIEGRQARAGGAA